MLNNLTNTSGSGSGRSLVSGCLVALLLTLTASSAAAQSVCLPLPRLLTTVPMGGQAGTQVELIISGDHIEDADQLYFSDPGITAVRKMDAAGTPEPNRYTVTISPECTPGLCEARVMTRLGISSSRVFSVGTLPEVQQIKPNTSLATAMPIPVNSVCNSVMTVKSVDHYSFEAKTGQRYLVDCAARRIDSKLEPVLVIADSSGRDLLVDRRGGMLDFTAPDDGRFVVKVHELTYRGGPEFFYRLMIRELPAEVPLPVFASVRSVSSFSWPPQGLPEEPAHQESEPNNSGSNAQKITLPCDLAGSFAVAADVDVFEFNAVSGDVWWVEVASQRLGRPTDVTLLVQHVSGEGDNQKLTDVAELSDIASPVKTSSNGYAYDGPPYDAGSSDILGKIEIKADGLHRMQLSDLFGGTRNDPRNVYRLIIRKAAPDFAVVGWGLHMELRNGDRNALSKPIALRGGATMALEVVTVRRDGFDGEIELQMDGLPEGVTAAGLKIPAGQSRGIMLITADQNAPRGLSQARFTASANINGQSVTHPCHMAAMAWPIADAWGEIPSPRLVTDVPVSVSGSEFAPVSIAAAEKKIWEAAEGQKLTIPLTHIRRSEFSGATLQLRTFGKGFEGVPQFDVQVTADSSQAVLDLAALKTPPGDYQIAFYGSAVARYRSNPAAVTLAEERHRQAEQLVASLSEDAKKLKEGAGGDSAATAAQTDLVVQELEARQKTAAADLAAAAEQLRVATERAKPQDTVEIIVSEPVAVRVTPGESK